jgi:hypothetical protein
VAPMDDHPDYALERRKVPDSGGLRGRPLLEL